MVLVGLGRGLSSVALQRIPPKGLSLHTTDDTPSDIDSLAKKMLVPLRRSHGRKGLNTSQPRTARVPRPQHRRTVEENC